ncbi:hypothetical protein HHK36_013113 [Tetracentron sinense]|uniref:glucan endo-1,3-beta-D-glucosidase n=1 Tax=Tetracentron sinense TaxID=13715 RepID=A0A834ZA76_TETSI|nr:hypothetical protein HHK36_013113 [Tetracentron sinense]
MGLVSLFFFLSLVSFSNADISSKIGVNYGQLGNNLPSPSRSIKLIKTMKAGRVKLYDANPEILNSLSGTKIQVSIMVPNQAISNISSNQTLADEWVRTNVLPFYPKTMIRFLLVGNEILSFFSDQDKKTWHDLVPAMRRIKHSLKTHDIRKIKVGTPLAMDALESSFPPSNGTFRSDISVPVMKPLLQFLNQTKSFFFLDVYPYFPWSTNPSSINLNYALFKGGNLTYTDPVSGLTYTNLLDQMLDSVFFAMSRLGFPNVRLSIAESGWPNAGDVDQIGANIYNAATYNRNLVRKMTAKPPVGTPARPGMVFPTFIFALYNENKKTGPGTERHWGLLYPNGTAVYEIDLTGKRPESEYKPLPAPVNNEPYKGKVWCVVGEEANANATEVGSALTYACGQGNGTCDAIQVGKECYEPDSLSSHASYAFSSYWAQFRSLGGTCYFNGLAVQTAQDPSTCSHLWSCKLSPLLGLRSWPGHPIWLWQHVTVIAIAIPRQGQQGVASLRGRETKGRGDSKGHPFIRAPPRGELTGLALRLDPLCSTGHPWKSQQPDILPGYLLQGGTPNGSAYRFYPCSRQAVGPVPRSRRNQTLYLDAFFKAALPMGVPTDSAHRLNLSGSKQTIRPLSFFHSNQTNRLVAFIKVALPRGVLTGSTLGLNPIHSGQAIRLVSTCRNNQISSLVASSEAALPTGMPTDSAHRLNLSDSKQAIRTVSFFRSNQTNSLVAFVKDEAEKRGHTSNREIYEATLSPALAALSALKDKEANASGIVEFNARPLEIPQKKRTQRSKARGRKRATNVNYPYPGNETPLIKHVRNTSPDVREAGSPTSPVVQNTS